MIMCLCKCILSFMRHTECFSTNLELCKRCPFLNVVLAWIRFTSNVSLIEILFLSLIRGKKSVMPFPLLKAYDFNKAPQNLTPRQSL